MATAKVVDLTNVKDGGNFNKRRMPAGDYPAKIIKVQDEKAKSDGEFQWLFTISVKGGGTYPYYCKLVENQLWKIRNLCLAAGMNVPKKRLKLDPEKLVGKAIAVTLEDDEYDGKKQSTINATFPLSELDDYDSDVDDDAVGDDDDDEDEDEVEEAPPAKKAVKKKAAAPEPEEDEEEDEDEEEEDEDELAGLDRDQLKRRLRKASPGVSISRKQTDDDLRDAIRDAEGSIEDEDDEDEDDEPSPVKKAAAKKRSTKVEDVTDDELDELDIDDI